MEDSKNVGVVNARSLNITWSGDPRYWRWVKETETSDDVAELLNVCRLQVRGQLEARGLSPGTKYEVVFVLKMKTRAYGWNNAPVNFRCTHPDSTNHFKTINLENMFKDSKDQWKDIPFGVFTATEDHHNIGFSMYKYGGIWKSGLVIKRVAVRPKEENNEALLSIAQSSHFFIPILMPSRSYP